MVVVGVGGTGQVGCWHGRAQGRYYCGWHGAVGGTGQWVAVGQVLPHAAGVRGPDREGMGQFRPQVSRQA